ncbi:MAG TPA: hypothetical protein VG248_10770 [Caulobacteraceae bacterium]|jgi:hypothetical protein|nr:hypothetical protein [Caulobacteraceae bacterium]
MSDRMRPLLAAAVASLCAAAFAPALAAVAGDTPPDAPTVQPAEPEHGYGPAARGAPDADTFDAAPPPQGDRERWGAVPRDPLDRDDDAGPRRRDAGPSAGVEARESELETMINREMGDGRLATRDARLALRQLHEIRDLDGVYRRENGRLSPDQRADLDERMTALASRLAAGRRADRDD